MSKRVIIRVSEEVMGILRAKAEAQGLNVGEVADLLIAGETNGGVEVIDGDQKAEVQAVAVELGLQESSTVARLLKMGLSRHRALRKYSKKD